MTAGSKGRQAAPSAQCQTACQISEPFFHRPQGAAAPTAQPPLPVAHLSRQQCLALLLQPLPQRAHLGVQQRVGRRVAAACRPESGQDLFRFLLSALASLVGKG